MEEQPQNLQGQNCSQRPLWSFLTVGTRTVGRTERNGAVPPSLALGHSSEPCGAAGEAPRLREGQELLKVTQPGPGIQTLGCERQSRDADALCPSSLCLEELPARVGAEQNGVCFLDGNTREREERTVLCHLATSPTGSPCPFQHLSPWAQSLGSHVASHVPSCASPDNV